LHITLQWNGPGARVARTPAAHRNVGARKDTGKVLDREILELISAVGAIEPQPGNETYSTFRSIFRRSNYFILRGAPPKPNKFLIVKISRSKTPFWGIGKDFLDLLNKFDQIYYLLVLLVSDKEGWVFSREEVNANVRSQKWKLREADNNYKINWPLPDTNSFTSPDTFLKRIGHVDN
jgi:hypothetical protein